MNTKNLTIGLDLGDRCHHACVLDEAGEILAEEVIVNTREVVTAFCARYPGATIVMETGTHSPWVSRLVAALGHPVIVANARKLRAISASQTKSDREDAAGPYLGLVPERDQSGLNDKQLGITKAGHVQLRCLLVNCAHYILGPFGPPCQLRAAGERIAARGGKSAKKRAVIAVARKLAVTLLALWKTGADYQPLPLSQAA